MGLKKARAARVAEASGDRLTPEQLEKLQAFLLSMYKDLVAVCRKYGITAYLCGGSALGAVRHGGFIPWDDDLDVAMTRRDYAILQSVFQKEMGDEYILNAPNYSKNAKARFPKLIRKGTVCQEAGSVADSELNGVFIDIFVIDHIPDGAFARAIKGFCVNLLEFVSGCVYDHEVLTLPEKKDMVLSIGASFLVRLFVGSLLSWKRSSAWFDLVDKWARHGTITKYDGLVTGSRHYFGEIFLREDLYPPKYINFCGVSAPVFHNVRKYLRNLCGRYWEIPKEEDRVKHNIRELQL